MSGMRLAAYLSLALLSGSAFGQEGAWKDRLGRFNVFNDSRSRVAVTIDHPPAIGLEVRSVAFAPPEGECAEEVVDLVVADFVSNGVTVTDRGHLEDLLDEHEFSVSGLVDRAVELGNIIGATELVFLKVHRCGTEQTMRSSVNSSYVDYTAVTSGHVQGSAQVIDLETARIGSALLFEGEHNEAAMGRGSRPPYPSSSQVLRGAIGRAVSDIHRMFFPWQETRYVHYFDEHRCDLRLAYRLMQAGDLEAALEQSRHNVDTCEAFREKKPGIVAKAYYNLGISHLVRNGFDEAETALSEALRLDPDERMSRGLAEVQRTREASLTMQEAQREDSATASEAGDDGSGNWADAAAGDGEDSRPVVERLDQLRELLAQDLISEELYRKRGTTIVTRYGPPGETVEEKLRNLKSLHEEGMLSEEVYEKQVSLVLGDV